MALKISALTSTFSACILLSNSCTCAAFFSPVPIRRRYVHGRLFSRSSLCMSNAAELHTSYEWLARQKLDAYREEAEMEDSTNTYGNNGKDSKLGHEIIWMDIESGSRGKSINTRANTSHNYDNREDTGASLSIGEGRDTMQLPLYPLGAVHLPSPDQIHTLNNIEPRNIKMAEDLADPEGKFDGRFCVTLRASDTGRIAQAATLMRVVNTTRQESFDGSLLAIRVECVAEGLVEVQQIINPNAWSKEQRLKKSDEYLVATVRPINEDTVDNVENAQVIDALAKQIENDFETVRKIYSNKDTVSTNELPEWAIDSIQSNLPMLSAFDFANDFWRCADTWQQITNTIRMARRSELNSDVNEITIDEACKLGGPLKLPVHRSDLPIDIQKRLNKMEEDAAENFIARGIDPIVDFQIILSMLSPLDRLKYLALIISRERRRLETKATLRQIFEAFDEDVADWSASPLNSNVTSAFD